ncbi:HAUS augmin-like complex subunit 7 isoform X1 [Oryzias melastigma]|uniref:HAUS augmin like complex subunit 7 n=2 Tax=Oryzias melastigma TaxID=30732 RepID=A0A3B3BYM5_ORYME|nr:HAUS augmin-like complex subunit 7 isoform X1 [Oryzias melastigma]
MAGSTDQLVRRVYDSLQAASCPLLQGLDLREADTMLQLLCSPSELRTSIMAWIFSSIHPNFVSKAVSVKNTDFLNKEMAALGEDLILCRRDDSDLIRGNTTPLRQLRFLEQLLTLIPNTAKPCGSCTGSEALLSELFADENLPHLRQMLEPALNPWPANIRALHKSSRSPFKPRKEAGDVAALLQKIQSELEQLQSKCDFLESPQKSSSFCASSLRLAAGDLQQLMTTFCPVYESNLRAHCSREPPSFSPETDIFQRVQQLLLACNTELEMLSEVSVASACVEEEVKQLQTQPRYWSHGEKLTLADQLKDFSRRIGVLLYQQQALPTIDKTENEQV